MTNLADGGDYVIYNKSLTIPPNSGTTLTNIDIGHTISDLTLETVEIFYAHIESDISQVAVNSTSNNATVRILDGAQSGW